MSYELLSLKGRWRPNVRHFCLGVLGGEGFGIIGLGVGALDDALKVVGVEEAVSWGYAHDGCVEEGDVGGVVPEGRAEGKGVGAVPGFQVSRSEGFVIEGDGTF